MMEEAVVATHSRLAQIARAARLAAREIYAERSLDRLEEIVSGHVWLGELSEDEAIQLWTLVPEFIQAIDLGYAHAGGPQVGERILFIMDAAGVIAAETQRLIEKEQGREQGPE